MMYKPKTSDFPSGGGGRRRRREEIKSTARTPPVCKIGF
jgi:hypothetical protein